MDYNKEFSAFFDEIAEEAGKIVLQYFRKELSIVSKDDRSPVTQADREIELKLRDMIGKKFPNHGIIGEEFGAEKTDAEFVWVIDPIDGTRAFMTGKPLFGTIVGLMHDDVPVVGMIDQAFIKERWFGVAGEFALYNGKPVRVAAPRSLEEARVFTGSPNMFMGEDFEAYLKLCQTARWPQYGCDCYAYGLMAMGWADVVVEKQLKIHDVAGIAPIITGAGGVAVDWNMQPVGRCFDGSFIAASSDELARQIVELFRRNPLC